MHTAVGNDMNEQMIVNSIDDFYLAITIDNGSTIMMSISAIWQLPNFNHNILNSFIMIL